MCIMEEGLDVTLVVDRCGVWQRSAVHWKGKPKARMVGRDSLGQSVWIPWGSEKT